MTKIVNQKTVYRLLLYAVGVLLLREEKKATELIKGHA